MPLICKALEGALREALVYGQANVSNRNYGGQIREGGNTVKIASIGDVTLGDYERNTEISDPEVLTDAEQSLPVEALQLLCRQRRSGTNERTRTFGARCGKIK